MMEQFTIHTTMHSSSIFLPTQINLRQFISKLRQKGALFGVCCEAIPRQVNFLLDESVLTGKGANCTTS